MNIKQIQYLNAERRYKRFCNNVKEDRDYMKNRKRYDAEWLTARYSLHLGNCPLSIISIKTRKELK